LCPYQDLLISWLILQNLNLIELDANALGQTHALDYQIRSLDAHGKTLFTSLLVPPKS